MSKKLKLSPWRKMEMPPTEVGLYELQQPVGETFVWSWWDVFFHGAWPSQEEAVSWKMYGPDDGVARTATAWRGVLK